jgi:hypothetical protein
MTGGTPTTRRAALAGAAGLLLVRPAAAAAAQSHAEKTAGALQDLIARERAAALAYGVTGRQRLAAHEEDHAAALVPHLQSVGHKPPPPPRDASQLRGLAAELAAAPPGGRTAAAVAMEEELIRAYRAALARLYDPATKRTAATIMASHGQHIVTLRPDPLISVG